MPKVGLVSLGCPKNLVDSEVMLGILAERGYQITPRAEEADVLIVNTCGFIDPAKQESINTILEMASHKKSGTARKLVVAGCLVERYQKEILRELPEVDAILGTNELERVAELCASQDGRKVLTEAAKPYLYDDCTPRVVSTPPYSAYIKIAEGCNHACSFCVIPQMRGRFRSRQFDSVVREAQKLARQGLRELTLVGQDTTSYGEDLGMSDGLAKLLRALGGITELVWIRFLYCYPNRVTEALIEAVAETPKVCKYFDIPFQHASPNVLKAMRRGSDGERFLRTVEAIRKAIPSATLRTSLITGFPGETERDFQILRDFVAAAEFDHVGVFLYSNEEGSRSFRLPRQVPPSVARQRQRQLMSLQRKISRRKLRRRIGQSLLVLVEGPAPETDLLWRGRLESQAPEIDGQVLINDFAGAPPLPGQFRWATITAASDYDLVARLEAPILAEPTPSWPRVRPALGAPEAASVPRAG